MLFIDAFYAGNEVVIPYKSCFHGVHLAVQLVQMAAMYVFVCGAGDVFSAHGARVCMHSPRLASAATHGRLPLWERLQSRSALAAGRAIAASAAPAKIIAGSTRIY